MIKPVLLCVLFVLVRCERNVLFPTLPVTVNQTENILCAQESRIYVQHLNNLTFWAQKIWDSTAKTSHGLLNGNVYQLGDYAECIEARAPFATQYCLATIYAHKPIDQPTKDPLSLHASPYETVLQRFYEHQDPSQQQKNLVKTAWCIPASCTPADLEKSLNKYLQEAETSLSGENVTYSASVPAVACQTGEERQRLDNVDIGFCFLLLLLIMFVILSTVYDYFRERWIPNCDTGYLQHRLLVSFSVRKNISELPKADESTPSLKIFHGVRIFCTLMIITVHRFGTFMFGPIKNLDYLENEYRGIPPTKWLLYHGDIIVDTFFTLSGILVAYGVLKQYEKKFVNPLVVVVLRYIRLTPVYAFVVFYYATVFNYIGSGPMWKMIVTQQNKACRENWYLNLLYLNNYIGEQNMCMLHSWYLPCDFHYFIVGLFICVLISKHKKIGLSVLLGLTVASMIVTFVVVAVYKRAAMLLFYPHNVAGPEFSLTYNKSHLRAAPYLIGLFAGYFYYKDFGAEKRFKWIKSKVVTVVSVLLMLVSMGGSKVFYDPEHKYNKFESATYAALHRASWSIGTLGILFATSYGALNPLRRFLTWTPWIPLSKLTYSAYLFHFQFQLRNVAMSPEPVNFDYFNMIWLSMGDWVLAFMSALVLYIMIEAPFRNIFKALLRPNMEKRDETIEPPAELPQGTSDSRL